MCGCGDRHGNATTGRRAEEGGFRASRGIPSPQRRGVPRAAENRGPAFGYGHKASMTRVTMNVPIALVTIQCNAHLLNCGTSAALIFKRIAK